MTTKLAISVVKIGISGWIVQDSYNKKLKLEIMLISKQEILIEDICSTLQIQRLCFSFYATL